MRHATGSPFFRRIVEPPSDPSPSDPRGVTPPTAGTAPSDSSSKQPPVGLVDCRFHSHAIPVSLPDDVNSTSQYQALLRENMLYVEAVKLDLQASTQGRNHPIQVGQVGILCRHCRNIPPRNRPRGAIYFPHKLLSIYQSAQNMANHHYNVESGCPNAPDEVNAAIRAARGDKSNVYGRGQQYWARSAVESGLVETEQGLAFAAATPPAVAVSLSLSSS
jgi:hypothetical protein